MVDKEKKESILKKLSKNQVQWCPHCVWPGTKFFRQPPTSTVGSWQCTPNVRGMNKQCEVMRVCEERVWRQPFTRSMTRGNKKRFTHIWSRQAKQEHSKLRPVQPWKVAQFVSHTTVWHTGPSLAVVPHAQWPQETFLWPWPVENPLSSAVLSIFNFMKKVQPLICLSNNVCRQTHVLTHRMCHKVA